MGRLVYLCFHLLIVSSVVRTDDDECVYNVFVRTGSVIKGGTDSKISLTLYDSDGWGIRINNLESWGGLMGPDYDYFERGNLDVFSGKGPCLYGRTCSMNLTSDGTGSGHGWYCNYVEVTTTGNSYLQWSSGLVRIDLRMSSPPSGIIVAAETVAGKCRSLLALLTFVMLLFSYFLEFWLLD